MKACNCIPALLFLIAFTALAPMGTAYAQDCTNPDGVIGQMIHLSDRDTFVGCTAGAGWVAFHNPTGFTPGPCTGSPSPGTTCADGSIYAGLSPDGNVPMYTTPADAPSLLPWNDGSPSGVDTAMVNCSPSGSMASCQAGEANTAILVSEDSDGGVVGVQPHQAAAYCDGLSAHGHSDWYLPARDELDALYDSKNAGDLDGTFNETGLFPAGWYWSSSEFDGNRAWFQRLSDGVQTSFSKTSERTVRCVRKN